MTATRRLALATCSEFPAGDPDDAPLPAAFAERGIDATWAVWDDPTAEWPAFDAVLLRSTWDYHERRDRFLDWCRSVPRLLNPPDLVEWNTDKRYLGDLAQDGVPVVPTSFFAPGEPFAAPDGPYVVKPSVSAGSRHTARFEPGDEERAAALAATIHASGRTVMVQPFVGSVDDRGETALLHFGGRFSHAAHKAGILAVGAEPTEDFFAPEEILPRTPLDAELDTARQAVASVARRFAAMPAYARVDIVIEGEKALVLELELTEPSLFLATHPAAARSLARAVAERLERS